VQMLYQLDNSPTKYVNRYILRNTLKNQLVYLLRHKKTSFVHLIYLFYFIV